MAFLQYSNSPNQSPLALLQIKPLKKQFNKKKNKDIIPAQQLRVTQAQHDKFLNLLQNHSLSIKSTRLTILNSAMTNKNRHCATCKVLFNSYPMHHLLLLPITPYGL